MNNSLIRWATIVRAGALCLLALWLWPGVVPAQHSFKFETQVRDRSGQPVPFAEGVFRVSILEKSKDGVPSFVEVHHTRANDCGAVTLEVGAGQPRWGSLDEVDWSDKCFLLIEHGPGEEGPFDLLGISEISAVPVALYAANAGSAATPQQTGCSPFGICVQSVGALADGQTDDTQAFQFAINLAAQNGYRVIVPAGVYRITQTLEIPDGVNLVGEGPGATPLAAPYNGSLIHYDGSGPAIRIAGHNAGLRELVIADANTGAQQADGIVVVADNRLVESVRLERVLVTNFTGGTALRLEAKNGGGLYYLSAYDVRVRHAAIGIHIVQDNTAAVNSNRFYHGAISGGGFDYGILVEGGNNNVLDGMVIEPPASAQGHLVVRAGEIHGHDIRIEGTSQSSGVPLVSFDTGTSHSVVGGICSGLVLDRGANFLDFQSVKNMDPAPETANLLENASFHGASNGKVPYWDVLGTGVTVDVLPPELAEGHNVLKLTVPPGVVCDLKPEALFLPKLMNRPEYEWIHFGLYVRTAAPGVAYTRYNAPAGLTASAPHPGDDDWHFIGMTAQTGPTPDPRFEVNNTTGAPLEVYVSMPVLSFGQALPTPAAKPITSAGGILTGTLTPGVVEVAPSGPFVILPREGNIFLIDGTPTISRINHSLPDRFPKGAVIVLVFNDAGANVTNNPYIVLKSGFTSTPNASLTLLSNGNGTWREIGRNL